MNTVQITRHAPPRESEEQLHEVGRTIRYRYHPDIEDGPGHATAFKAWLDEPMARRALALINDNPDVFQVESEIRWPLQEIYAHPPQGSRLVRSLGVAVTPLIIQLILQNAPVGTSSSGGKDGSAAAFAEDELLDWLGHTGKRIILFSDIGRLDWPDSPDSVRRLADALRRELVVVKMVRGMIGEWLGRWQRNVERYAKLSCVKIIMPWSGVGSMRFCTKAKTTPLTQDLVRRFPNTTIINTTGIRREESRDRLHAEVCAPQPELRRVKLSTHGFDYHPVLHWREAQVLAYLEARGFRLPNSYRLWGMGRHSCRLCVLGNAHDIARSIACEQNRDVLFELINLEISSTFSFQPEHWLADYADQQGLLDQPTRQALQEAKERARERQELEELIPKDLLFDEHWPRRAPDPQEARTLAQVRTRVAELTGISINFTEPERITERFNELLEMKRLRDEKNRHKPKKEKARKKKRKAGVLISAPAQEQLPLGA